jgi:CHAD domain-containing protein
MKAVDSPPRRGTASRTTTAGDWLQHMLVLIALQARHDVACMAARPKAAIHSLRKRMKKIQSLLHLADPVVGERQREILKSGIREIKEMARPQRDADVMSHLASDLGVKATSGRASLPDAAMLDAFVSELIMTFEEMDLHGLTWNGVMACHLRTCRSARKAWKKARRHHSEEHLHAWRKKVKRQYHQCLALRRWLGQTNRLRRMRRLGSMLGHRHDLDLFATALGFKESDGAAKKTRHKVGSRRKKLTRRIFDRAEKLFARSPSKAKHRLCRRLPSVSEMGQKARR